MEVSPSTLIRLKLTFTVSSRAVLIISGEMAQSVVKKHNIVPILGWIMPLPFAMPPMRTLLPPMTVSTATSFFTRSVVMIAWAAASDASAECSSAAYSAGMPSSITLIRRVWPITPVEETTTSSGLQPISLAAAWHILIAFSSPLGAQALALPLFTIMARAFPSARCFLSTWMGAALTAFLVNTAAAEQSTSETIRATSFFQVALVLTPTWMPAALKPCAAQTPPSINFIDRSSNQRVRPVASSSPSIMFMF